MFGEVVNNRENVLVVPLLKPLNVGDIHKPELIRFLGDDNIQVFGMGDFHMQLVGFLVF